MQSHDPRDSVVDGKRRYTGIDEQIGE